MAVVHSTSEADRLYRKPNVGIGSMMASGFMSAEEPEQVVQ